MTPEPSSEAERAAREGPTRDQWRARFAAAREHIEAAQHDRDEAQRYVDSGGPEWLFQRHRRLLAQAEQRLHDAEEALNDLERKASEQSVPLEWRR
jgi:hypothetical protein